MNTPEVETTSRPRRLLAIAGRVLRRVWTIIGPRPQRVRIRHPQAQAALAALGVLTVLALTTLTVRAALATEAEAVTYQRASDWMTGTSIADGPDVGEAADRVLSPALPSRTLRFASIPPENSGYGTPTFDWYPAMTTHTPEGADSALSFFIEALHFGEAIGDLRPLASVMDMDSCASCRELYVDLKRDLAQQRTASWPEWRSPSAWTVTFYDPEPQPGDEGALFRVQQEGRRYLENGREVRTEWPQHYNLYALMRWNGEHWVIVELVKEPVEVNVEA